MPALSAEQFQALTAGGAVPLDLRTPSHFAEGHIPGSIFLQFGRLDLGERAELFLPKDQTFVVLMEPHALGPIAEKLLAASGFQVAGFLHGGLKSWTGAGLPIASIPTMDVTALKNLIGSTTDITVVDVREDFEYEWGHIGDAINLPLGEVWHRSDELDSTQTLYVVCNDQVRSGAAASALKRLGFQQQVVLVLGGTSSWIEAGYPLTKAG